MIAKEAARIFHDWATREGLVVGQPALPSTQDESSKIAPLTEAGRTLLRQKQVMSICFSEAQELITVFTRLVPPKAKKTLATLPSSIENVSIRYRQGSHITAGDLPVQPFGGPAYIVRTSLNGDNRYTCGSSISVGNNVDAGTLGALVQDANGQLYGLSNNHVTGCCNFAERNLPIVAPGIRDVTATGLSPFTIGRHHIALPLQIGSPDTVDVTQNTDAAIFRIENSAIVSSHQGDSFDTPSLVDSMAGGMTVRKVGRTTGHTSGEVIGQQYGQFSVNYSAQRYGFMGSIYFENVFTIQGIGDSFSDHGDSGSLIVSNIQGVDYAVGIVFAGMQDANAPGGKITLALPIEPILTHLGVSLVSGHNL